MSIVNRLQEFKEKAAAKSEGSAKAVVMVRMTPTLHETLKSMAHEQKTSLNQLCVVALEQARDELFGQANTEPGDQ